MDERGAIRTPSVAGMFYPSGKADLREQIESCFLGAGGPGSLPRATESGKRTVAGLVSPHAGYMYSGPVAAWAYHRLAEDGLPETAILIGPNHRSYFPPVALTNERAWRTPLGDIELDTEVTRRIAEAYQGAEVRASVHAAEHSLEVQVPFLQYISEMAGVSIRIVPVLIGASADGGSVAGQVRIARELGAVIAGVISERDAVVIASTDFTHYEPARVAESKDSQAISCILALDEEELLTTVESHRITMCGALPTAVTICACRELGARQVEQLSYRNSGDVTGDYTEVVGYAALAIHR